MVLLTHPSNHCLLFLWLLVSCFGASPPLPHRLILLDVDNTLYREEDCGIERQIIANLHSCVGDAARADTLHREYGSTIRGVVATEWKNLSLDERNQRQAELYESVYRSVDVASILAQFLNQQHAFHHHDAATTTGYTSPAHRGMSLRSILRAIVVSSNTQLGIASCSPSFHVARVLQALGLAQQLPVAWIYTPDRDPSFSSKPDPPTEAGWPPRAVLIDDSVRHVEALQSVLAGTVLCKDGDVISAICQAMDWMPSSDYTFSDVDYLTAKNAVDRAAWHLPTWDRVRQELIRELYSGRNTEPLVIVDVGAGLLSMLELCRGGTDRLAPLLPAGDVAQTVHYHAYESNANLYEAGQEKLRALGFEPTDDDTNVWEAASSCGRLWIVHWHGYDYTNSGNGASCVDPSLIIGCCFADLMDPHVLVASLLRTFGCSNQTSKGRRPMSTLVYLPITFTGITQALPPGGFDDNIPSDTHAFRLYTQALRDHQGHHPDPLALQAAFRDYGGTLLAQGPSPWMIDPQQHAYLWKTMLYFVGRTAGPLIAAERWDAAAWLQRTWNGNVQKTLRVSNVDLLFRLPQLGHWKLPENQNAAEKGVSCCRSLQFIGPRAVTTNETPAAPLGPNQIRIQSEYSLISSGTELKIYTGDFATSQPLDLTIAGMQESAMTYPLAYGYSLVGCVVDCGEGVDPDTVLGQRVFVFAPHASQVVSDVGAVQFVPNGIPPEDAVFLPAMETALSLVQEARLVLGENVAVFGQGLIGLLVTALLALQQQQTNGGYDGEYGTVTAFDTVADRLAFAAQLGASQALFPSNDDFQFDVAIEVSGNGGALQSAIDSTRDGGRILIGSWYGDTTEVALKLGMDFHRSHKTLQASQVSEIPPVLSKTWDKERRFRLAWKILREVRPSQLITLRTGLEHAAAAYDALSNATEVAVVFEYSKDSGF